MYMAPPSHAKCAGRHSGRVNGGGNEVERATHFEFPLPALFRRRSRDGAVGYAESAVNILVVGWKVTYAVHGRPCNAPWAGLEVLSRLTL